MQYTSVYDSFYYPSPYEQQQQQQHYYTTTSCYIDPNLSCYFAVTSPQASPMMNYISSQDSSCSSNSATPPPMYYPPLPVVESKKSGGGKKRITKSTRARRNHESEGDCCKQFKCNIDYCGKEFKRAEHLKRHVKSIHDRIKGKNPHSNQGCHGN